MLSKTDKDQSAMSATLLIANVRIAARTLVRREEYRVGSRMVAYENVASEIGASGSWLRQFIGRAPHVSLSFVVGMNILERYYQLCGHVEDIAEQMQHETHESDLELAECVYRALGKPPTHEEVAEALPEDHQ